MSIAYVLIRAHSTKEKHIYNEMAKVPEVKEFHPLFGKYDIIAKVEADNPSEIGETVINKIRNIKGIKDTTTLPCYDS